MEKEKATLTGVNETLFVPLYARALESRKPDHLFYDATAVRVIDALDYNFEQHNSKMNMWGCAARILLFDQCAEAHIKAHPDCAVINLACGLDDRFHRVDNGRIHWYNVDFPDVIQLRKELIEPNDRVTDIACSAFDYDTWMGRVADKEHALVICEGFLMYITAEQARKLFGTIAVRFTHTELLLELMTQWMVDHQKFHDTTRKTGVIFQWGIQKTEDFTLLCPQYKMVDEFNFTDGMKHFAPVRIALIAPILRKKNNRLGRFQQL